MMKIVFKNGESIEVGDVIGNEISKSISDEKLEFIRVTDENDNLLLLINVSEIKYIMALEA